MNSRAARSSNAAVKVSARLALALGGLVACGAPAAPQAPRQEKARAVTEAVDGKEATSTEPLAVGLRPEDRASLEVAMREGVAVVALRGASFQVLRGCRGAGDYGVVRVLPKEHAVHIADEQELRANVPNLLPALAASLKADLERGATVDVSLVVTSMMRTTRAEVSPKELTGACEGATHFVRGASLGAFTLATGERAKDGAEAGALGARVAGGRASSRQERSREGELEVCRDLALDAPSDARCKALVRLELAPLGAATAQSDVARGVTCPSGLVYLDGKCARFPAPEDLPCMKGNVQACTTRCEKSEAKACGVLAGMHVEGDGVAKDEGKALALARRGCEGKDGEACALVAKLAAGKDPAAAVNAALEACKLGVMPACITAGQAYENGAGVTKAIGIAVASYQRGCDGGYARACWELGRYRERRTGPKSFSLDVLPIDKGMVRLARERSCNGRIVQACREVARWLGEADKSGEPWLVRGCDLGDGAACVDLAKRRGYGTPEWLDLASRGCRLGAIEETEYHRDYTASQGCNDVGLFHEREKRKLEAASFLTRGCNQGSTSACWNAANLFEGADKVPWHERGCALGAAAACNALTVAALDATPADPKRALSVAEKTCASGDAQACFYAGMLHAGDDPARWQFPKSNRRRFPGLVADRARSKTAFDKACTVNPEIKGDDTWCKAAKRYLERGDTQ